MLSYLLRRLLHMIPLLVGITFLAFLVIGLAFIAAGIRASQGAWVEATGLAALGTGLVVLKLAAIRPAIKPLAYIAFLITAASIGLVLVRR